MANLKDLIVQNSAKFLGKIEGCIQFADKASADEFGNNIKSTYRRTEVVTISSVNDSKYNASTKTLTIPPTTTTLVFAGDCSAMNVAYIVPSSGTVFPNGWTLQIIAKNKSCTFVKDQYKNGYLYWKYISRSSNLYGGYNYILPGYYMEIMCTQVTSSICGWIDSAFY